VRVFERRPPARESPAKTAGQGVSFGRAAVDVLRHKVGDARLEEVVLLRYKVLLCYSIGGLHSICNSMLVLFPVSIIGVRVNAAACSAVA
jgi:hypothetical protein